MKRLSLIIVLVAWFPAGLVAAQQNDPPLDRKIVVRMAVPPDQGAFPEGVEPDPMGLAPDRAAIDYRITQRELDLLREAGVPLEVIEMDIYAAWDRASTDPGFAGDGPWEAYHNLTTAYQFLDDLHAAHPDVTSLIELGTTIEGRPIRGIRISSDPAQIDHSRPAIFVTGCHHAREWIAVEGPLYIAERLAMGYGIDPEITRLLDRAEIWIVPIVNPDGFRYTETNRFWRKNRRDNGDGTFGVDLNRNYSFKWGQRGASASTSSQTYRGAAAFSEPETQAIRDAFDLRTFAVGLTYHSYAQLVMSPWGYTTLAPPDSIRMEALAANMASSINRNHSSARYDYTSGRWGVALYIGSGIFVDWVFGEHGVPGIIVEMRPRSSNPGFALPATQILETCIENYAGFFTMAQEIAVTWCYADFDRSTGTGVLDIFDFLKFQDEFVRGDPFSYACECDTGTGLGVCDIFDFLCFQNAFVAGCR